MTSTVPFCADSTSGKRRYACGLSSSPPPRRMTPLSRTQDIIISDDTAPGLITWPVRRFTLPAAAVRDITRPAPWTVEYNASRCSSATFSGTSCAPRTITASSPIEPPTNPF